jgi:hypothetical protein
MTSEREQWPWAGRITFTADELERASVGPSIVELMEARCGLRGPIDCLELLRSKIIFPRDPERDRQMFRLAMMVRW